MRRFPSPAIPGWLAALWLGASLACSGPASAAGPLCAINPFQPACCPMPCPVFDQSKLARYLDEARQAWQKVDECRAMADQYLSLATAFGPDGPLARELRRVPGNVTGVFTAFKASLPEMVKPGDLADPRAVSEILKRALLDPPAQDGAVSGGVGQAETRLRLDTDETVQALASGLHAFGRLGDLAVDRSAQTAVAARATDARADLAANAAARQALLDNMGGLKQLLSAWAATQAVAAVRNRPAYAGSAGGGAPAASSLAAGLQAQADQAQRAQRVRAAVDAMDATVSALTSLHNERHAVKVILSQYPSLWNTVASDNAAIRFRSDDEAKATMLLAGLFLDGGAAFARIKLELLAGDRTGWKDAGVKTQAARAAAAAAVGSLAAQPAAYGQPRMEPPMLTPEFADGLAEVFAAWLEDDKLERFWQPLRADADKAIGSLDRRVTQISQRRGFDIATAAALNQENRLLAAFEQQDGQWASVDMAGLAAPQAAFVTALVGAFRETAATARSDAPADNFLSVVWPQ